MHQRLPPFEYISGLLKTVWTFFPSLLFIFLTIFCFWIRGQGKDIMIAFTEGNSRFDGRLIIFFMAIGFYVYVTWYSSRVIAFIKEKNSGFRGNFLDAYPRLAGNAVFLVLELAVFQSPLLGWSMSLPIAWGLFFVALILLHFADKYISNHLPDDTKGLANRFWIVFAVFFILLLITAFTPIARTLYTLFGLLVILHVVYLFYISLHRVERVTKVAPQPASGLIGKLLDYFCIPHDQFGYFKWYNVLSVVALLVDIIAIFSLGFSRGVGPFPLLILAFSVLLAFGNLITAFAVKYSVNFHLLLFLVAFFLGLKETHRVRVIPVTANDYASRPALKTYLRAWLRRVPDSVAAYDVYFVLANGGASRSGFWTASILGRLEDASIAGGKDRFSDHVFCLSGTSGGGMGVATFFALLNDKHNIPDTFYRQSAAQFLQRDYFTYTAARMLGPDYFNYIFHLWSEDRGAALEESFERFDDTTDSHHYNPRFYQPVSRFKTLTPDSSLAQLPILFVNTTRMQDGNPGIVTNLKPDSAWFNQRVDVLGLLGPSEDISLASGAILGARFPYLSPAGRIGNSYFVDGGYFDNSGSGVVQELLRGIVNISSRDTVLSHKLHQLRFHVLHILNSPIIADSNNIQPVAPIKNDLFAPLATIVGAYDMQTTVNDGRLKNLIDDINYSLIPADYTMISLYKDATEWAVDPLNKKPGDQEPSYSMNWFMSDTTRSRINQRLDQHPVVQSLAKKFIEK